MVTVFRTKGYILTRFYAIEIYFKKKKKVICNSLIIICQHPTSKLTKNNIDWEQMSYPEKEKKKKFLEYKSDSS